jgi:hypothetical protein
MMRRALGCILMVSLILVLIPSTLWADKEVANPENLFPIVKDAGGVRVHGQLAIYYDVVPNGLGCALDQVNMFFVLRLQKSEGAPAGFAGSLRNICYEDGDDQIAAVLQLVTNTVIPYFFPRAQSRTFNLTDVNQIVQDNQAQPPPPYFFLMNVEFRVRG